jgi:serine/threonine protein kinase
MMSTASVSQQIDGYTIDRKLTAGGMAEIYLGHRAIAGFDERVVLKSLPPDFVHDQDFVAMMLNEARLGAGLVHPNIVRVRDLVEVGGRPFIVMEYLAGQNLREIVVRALSKKRMLSVGFVCHAVSQVLAGLGHAHNCVDDAGRPLGVVHRDVSLANVIVTWTGTVKLIDFGIAKATTSGVDEQLTRAGQVKGKSAYMSPEQVQQKPLDARSDLFSVGILLWELLTQRRLFSRKADMDAMMAICCEDAPAPSSVAPELPAALDRICAKALARDREARYQTAEDMRADLEAVLAEGKWSMNPVESMRSELAALFPIEIVDATMQPLDRDAGDEDKTVPLPQAPTPPRAARRPQTVAQQQQQQRTATLRATEMALFNQRLPGPSVYDEEPTTPGWKRPLTPGVVVGIMIALVYVCVVIVVAMVMR